MDIGLLYGDFVMDNRELILHIDPGASSIFRDYMGAAHCTITAFRNEDPDIERDPLSTNRRLFDSTTCTADDVSPADLQHLVGLSLGPAENLSAILPREELHLALCDNSLRPTLTAGRKDYWSEITPLLRKWQCVNDTACPHCNSIIRVNMSRHLRASHTDNQCDWRCPVLTCPMWFSSELNGKDHIERIHSFREGQGCSFYECLRNYGMEWFEQRGQTSQALWMDLALARQSGQELSNHYVITNSLAMAHLLRFFRAAVRSLTSAYDDLSMTQVVDDVRPSIRDQMRREIADDTEEFDPSTDQASGFDMPVREAATPTVLQPTATPSPVVETPRRSISPNNRSLAVLESGQLVAPQCHMPLAMGGCFKCIDRQHGTTNICRTSATRPVDLSHTQFRTGVANRGTRRSISCGTPGSGGGSPERGRVHVLP